MDEKQVARLEELRCLYERSAVDAVEIHPCEGRGVRHRVRLSVRGGPGDVGIGIFEQGSHRLVSIPNCLVHHESIQSFLPDFVALANECQIEPYEEQQHAGCLRAVQLAVERHTGRLQVVLLVKDDLRKPPSRLGRLVNELHRHPLVDSLFLGALPHRGNSLMAQNYQLQFGEAFLSDQCAGATNFYPPGAFGQANPEHHERLVERVHELIPRGRRIVEYYAGVGTIGLSLIARGDDVVFNEVGSGSIVGLREGWRRLRGEEPLELLEGKAGDSASAYAATDTVIVDPPRKGLDSALFERLRDEPPSQLVYVSCGIDALLRECEAWATSGLYQLEHLSAWAYFPFTSHVETLVALQRITDQPS